MTLAQVGDAEASEFLTRHFDGSVTGIVALAGGAWSRAFGFSLEGAPLVVRFGSYREDFEADREAMSFAGPDLPIPRVLEIGEAFGGYYALSERCFGSFLEELDEPATRQVLAAVLRALDALRALPTRTGANWHGWLRAALVDRPGGRVSGWRPKLARSPDAELTFVEGGKVMESLLPACPELGHVLHLDLINRNVLVNAEDGEIAAIFDWGCMTRGDFLYEVAWFDFWSAWYPGLAAVDWRHTFLDHYKPLALQVPNFDERLRCYELHIGLHHLAYNAFVGGRDEDTALLVRRIRRLM